MFFIWLPGILVRKLFGRYVQSEECEFPKVDVINVIFNQLANSFILYHHHSKLVHYYLDEITYLLIHRKSKVFDVVATYPLEKLAFMSPFTSSRPTMYCSMNEKYF